MSYVSESQFNNDNINLFIENEYSMNLDLQVMPYKTALTEFLNRVTNLERPKNNNDTNIIDIQRGKCYHFDKDTNETYTFFNLIEVCRKQGIVLMFSEKQNPKESGIMLDFDFKLKDKNNNKQITDFHKVKLVRHIVKVLNQYFDLKEYIKQSKYIITGISTSEKTNNFHLLIPGIFLSRIEKLYLIDKIINSKILDLVFNDLIFDCSNCVSETAIIPECPLDRNSKHVPVFFIGNTRYEKGSKRLKSPYILTDIYYVDVQSDIDATRNNDILKNNKINFSLEFSLNFENLNTNFEQLDFGTTKLINKVKINCKPEYENEISALNKKMGRSMEDLEEIENIDSSLSILKVVDIEIEYTQSLLDILAPWRSQEFWPWFCIIRILASMGEEYRILAIYFSMKCSEKFRKDEFNRTWDNCICEKYYISKDRAMGTLQFFAKKDDPKKYEDIKAFNIRSFLYKLIYDITIEGGLEHDHVARLLHKMCRYKFAMDIPKGAKKFSWYEFYDVRR